MEQVVTPVQATLILLINALNKNYNITQDGNVWVIQVKSGHDFPYRIRLTEKGYVLSKAYSPRIYIKPTFNQMKVCATFDEALAAIAKRDKVKLVASTSPRTKS